jgi:hypothetical protein
MAENADHTPDTVRPGEQPEGIEQAQAPATAPPNKGRPRAAHPAPTIGIAVGGPMVVRFEPADLVQLANKAGRDFRERADLAAGAAMISDAFHMFPIWGRAVARDAPAAEKEAWCATLAEKLADVRLMMGGDALDILAHHRPVSSFPEDAEDAAADRHDALALGQIQPGDAKARTEAANDAFVEGAKKAFAWLRMLERRARRGQVGYGRPDRPPDAETPEKRRRRGSRKDIAVRQLFMSLVSVDEMLFGKLPVVSSRELADDPDPEARNHPVLAWYLGLLKQAADHADDAADPNGIVALSERATRTKRGTALEHWVRAGVEELLDERWKRETHFGLAPRL